MGLCLKPEAQNYKASAIETQRDISPGITNEELAYLGIELEQLRRSQYNEVLWRRHKADAIETQRAINPGITTEELAYLGIEHEQLRRSQYNEVLWRRHLATYGYKPGDVEPDAHMRDNQSGDIEYANAFLMLVALL